MKSHLILHSLAITGTILTFAAPGTHAQEAVRADTYGTLLTPLSLGSANFTGTLPPGRLGTGTPSSGTVLRGDGSWAGTTSTGNTLAATGNLLMGDGAGNALGVATDVDLQRVFKLRTDLSNLETALPVNLANPGNLVIRNGTFNADGTVTIPANDYVYWVPTDTAALPHYAYAAAVRDTRVGPTNGFLIAAYCHGYQTIPEDNVSSSSPAPGVSKCTFTNLDAYYHNYTDYGVYVVNTTSAPVTIFPPVVTTTDVGLLLMPSFADTTTVPPPPLRDLDFSTSLRATGDRPGRYLAERQTTLAADSVNGSSDNPGTLYAPKPTLPPSVTDGSVCGLYRGSLFRDSLQFATLGTTHGLVAQDVALGSVKPLPIISGMDPVPNDAVTGNPDGTYSYLWTLEAAATTNYATHVGYDNVFVAEVNTATEAAAPIASRRRLVEVTTSPTATGSVWLQPPGTSPGQSGSATQWKAVFRPSDNLAPGTGSYRYEVTTRFQPVNFGGSAANVGDGALSGVQLVAGTHGYGSLTGPPGFVGDRLAFIQATTHNAVIGGGSLQRSVFYESGDLVPPGPSIQLAWYSDAGAGKQWSLHDCLFYANVGDRYANCLIAHTGGTSFDRGDIYRCAFLGARWSDTSLQGTAIEYANVAAGVIDSVYVCGIRDVFGPSMPTTTEVRNSIFQQVYSALLAGSFHDNIVEAQGATNATDPQYHVPCGFLLHRNGATAANNLIWAHGLAAAVTDNSAIGFNFDPSVNTGTSVCNIIILNPASPAGEAAYSQRMPAALSGVTVDHNLVICTGRFRAPNLGGDAYTSWSAYQAGYPTLDQHSMFVDLSNDPRGLGAVFIDPVNGDFRWAQTEVAQRCAAYCAANHVGPSRVTSRWPVVPPVDEAVRLLTEL